MFYGLQPLHIVVIVVVALVVFGPSNLGKVGRSLGRTLEEFRQTSSEARKAFTFEPNTSTDRRLDPLSSAPQMANGMNCLHCSEPNPPAARFCNRCGKPINPQASA